MNKFFVSMVLLIFAVVKTSHAQIVDFHPAGFTVEHVIELNADTKLAFEKLSKISEWWDPNHTFSGNAKNLSLDLKPGGCWCETLPEGGFAKHAEVIRLITNSSIILNGALGPLQDLGFQGNLGFYFSTTLSNKTLLKLRYSVVGHTPDNAHQLAQAVDQTLLAQLMRLKNKFN